MRNTTGKNSEGILLSLIKKENDKEKAKYGLSFREMSFLLTRGLVSVQKVESNETVKIQIHWMNLQKW